MLYVGGHRPPRNPRREGRVRRRKVFSTGIASAVKTLAMGVRVVVREGEDVRAALRRLRQALEPLRRRRFIKGKRGDYYVKPCETRRRLEYEARCWKKQCLHPKN